MRERLTELQKNLLRKLKTGVTVDIHYGASKKLKKRLRPFAVLSEHEIRDLEDRGRLDIIMTYEGGMTVQRR